MIDGPDLVTTLAGQSHRVSLRSGRMTVLPRGSLRGCGKAWLLTYPGHKGRPVPKLLLGDPRTGRLRSSADLRALATVLRDSDDERDQSAALSLEELAAQASRSESPSVDTPTPDDMAADLDPPTVWGALKGLGRIVPMLGVVATVALAGGWAGTDSEVVRPALILAGAGLFGLWVLYTLYRTIVLLGALLTAARILR